MLILVANIGSTSFKYRLYDMPAETLLARGGVERIGSEQARTYVNQPAGIADTLGPVRDHGQAVSACLSALSSGTNPVISSPDAIAAIGFKAVHAKGVTGVTTVDDHVLAAMDAYAAVAPAHNPPYTKAMRQLREAMPQVPLVAAFETGFHQTIPPMYRHYGVPYEWSSSIGIERHGFHGASHRYIAERLVTILGTSSYRAVSCHLGGSSSLAAIKDGKSLGASMGMSPQSGLPHNNRVGDFDVFALPAIMDATGLTLDQTLAILANESGLKGLSGAGNDLRDIEKAADAGEPRAQLALDVFVGSIRDYLGAFLVRLGGLDALVFTGGIGENSARIRFAVCAGLSSIGLQLDVDRNQAARGEYQVSPDGSPVAIWTLPTNEEIIVARQTFDAISQRVSPVSRS